MHPLLQTKDSEQRSNSSFVARRSVAKEELVSNRVSL